MATMPSWECDPNGEASTLVGGTIRGRVWRRKEKWEAIISQHGGFLSAGAFRTAEEAQAWCEARVAERQAKCLEDVVGASSSSRRRSRNRVENQTDLPSGRRDLFRRHRDL